MSTLEKWSLFLHAGELLVIGLLVWAGQAQSKVNFILIDLTRRLAQKINFLSSREVPHDLP